MAAFYLWRVHMSEYYEHDSQPLHKICENTGFHWAVFSRIRTESYIFSLYGRIRLNEKPYSRIFYAVNLWDSEEYSVPCQTSKKKINLMFDMVLNTSLKQIRFLKTLGPENSRSFIRFWQWSWYHSVFRKISYKKTCPSFISSSCLVAMLKVGLSPSKKFCLTCFNESLLKMTKNVFYFILNVFLILKIFNFFSWLFVHVEKMAWLER